MTISFRRTDWPQNRKDTISFVSSLLRDHKQQNPLFFLLSQDQELSLAWGSVHTVFASGENRTDQLREKIHHCEQGMDSSIPPWFGGLSFFSAPSKNKKDIWEDFPNSVFFLPKNFIHFSPNNENGYALSMEKDMPNWNKAQEKTSPMGFGNPVDQDQDKEQWGQLFQSAATLLEEGRIKKIVLSQKKTFQILEKASLENYWKHFYPLLDSSPHTNLFCFLWKDSLFMGLSPEHLFLLEEKTLSVPAIAGTASRGASPTEDKELEKKLLASSKERLEHDIVVQWIQKKFAGFGKKFPHCVPKILKLQHIQHLYTNHQAILEENPDPWDLLKAFHPTPAMCGHPQKKALAFLADKENYNRGLYASPIGYVSPRQHKARFVIGIRSALAQKEQVHVFGGAGIVPNSQVQEEWREINKKMRPAVDIFTRGNHG